MTKAVSSLSGTCSLVKSHSTESINKKDHNNNVILDGGDTGSREMLNFLGETIALSDTGIVVPTNH